MKNLQLKLIVSAMAVMVSLPSLASSLPGYAPQIIKNDDNTVKAPELQLTQKSTPTIYIKGVANGYKGLNPQKPNKFQVPVFLYSKTTGNKVVTHSVWFKMAVPIGPFEIWHSKPNTDTEFYLYLPQNQMTQDVQEQQIFRTLKFPKVPAVLIKDAEQECLDQLHALTQKNGGTKAVETQLRLQGFQIPWNQQKTISPVEIVAEADAWRTRGVGGGVDNSDTKIRRRVKYAIDCGAFKPIGKPSGGTQQGGQNKPGTQKKLVESVKLSQWYPSSGGACPAKLSFTLEIKTNLNATPIQYREKYSTGKVSAVKQVQVSGKTVNKLVQIDVGVKAEKPKPGNTLGAQQQNSPQLSQGSSNQRQGWIEVETLSPNKKSDRVYWKYTCQKEYQGNNVEPLVVSIPDIQFSGELKLAGKVSTKGVLELGPSDAISQGARGCVFKSSYMIRSKDNKQINSAFKNRIVEGGKTLSTQTQSGLKSVATIKQNVVLKDGLHILNAELDAENAVSESNEKNNAQSLRVSIKGCNG
ncbi:MAG: hypothetical protein ACSHXK_08730 [Oceanococcus sp.]